MAGFHWRVQKIQYRDALFSFQVVFENVKPIPTTTFTVLNILIFIYNSTRLPTSCKHYFFIFLRLETLSRYGHFVYQLMSGILETHASHPSQHEPVKPTRLVPRNNLYSMNFKPKTMRSTQSFIFSPTKPTPLGLPTNKIVG